MVGKIFVDLRCLGLYMPVFPSTYAAALCSGREPRHHCANVDQDDGMFHNLGVPGDLFYFSMKLYFLLHRLLPFSSSTTSNQRVQS